MDAKCFVPAQAMNPVTQSEGPPSTAITQQKTHVLVGVTGSVAALKLPLLVSELLKIPGIIADGDCNHEIKRRFLLGRKAMANLDCILGSRDITLLAKLEVQVVTTQNAKHFYDPQEISVTLYSDSDEWKLWKSRTDPVLHIDLRRWADLMLVAPLDANTLAKIANGYCDNLLTCVIRAWDLSKPLLFCPAMNTAMWEHPITAQQVERLKAFGYMEIPCIVKKLVCGDEGRGAMAEVPTIVEKVKEVLSERGLAAFR